MTPSKKFRIQISAYKYHADFVIECVETPENIENTIVDRLGKGDIKWEYLGEMNDPKVNRITYEEVIDGRVSTSSRPLQTEERSGVRMGAGAS
jgi:hypothetical protein|tara:strand:- start:181 stop:459 length:279 start_codon:yes stop_codon:yes gene_type:complete